MLLLLGAHSAVAVLLAALAVITLGLHLAVVVGLTAGDLARGLLGAHGRSPAGVAGAAEAGGAHD